MAIKESKPFLYNMQEGRNYYGESLGIGNESQEVWTDHSFQSGYRESHPFSGRALSLGVGVGAYALLRSNPVLWDQATQAARALEDTVLPFKWGRTFQISNMMSNREAAVRETMSSGMHFKIDKDQPYQDYLEKLVKGRATTAEFKKQGFSLKDNKLYVGNILDTDPNRAFKAREVLGHAEVIRLAEGGSNAAGAAYTKTNVSDQLSSRFNTLTSTVRNPRTGSSEVISRPQIKGMPIQVIGGQTEKEAALNRVKAFGAEFGVYRFNRLLDEDFRTNPLTAGIAKKLKEGLFGKFFSHGLGVKPGAPLETFARLGVKLTALTTGIPLLYEQLDWTAEQILGFGPTKLAASAYVGGRVAYAHALDMLEVPFVGDLYDAQEAMEQWVPGVTDPMNIAKLGGAGFMTGATAIGLMERNEALRKTILDGAGSGSFWEKYKLNRDAVHQQYLNFEFAEDHKLAWMKKWGTAQPGSVYESRGNWKGIAWRALTKGVAETQAPTPATTLPVNLRLPMMPLVSLGRATAAKLGGFVGAAMGVMAAAPSLLGLIVPDERPEELEAIYSGRQEVEVRKGRWWEFGTSKFEGEEVLYYRPHWYKRMMDGGKDKQIWGEDHNLSPIHKAGLSNFSYFLEEKQYYDRPYPITALPFKDVPILGNILAPTLGRIIKPPALMHTDEWQGSAGSDVLVGTPSFGDFHALSLGEMPGGTSESPYSLTRSAGDLYRGLSQQSGLMGYALGSMMEGVTGTPGLFDQTSVLESFNNVTSTSRDFYDQSLGGMLGLNEAYRRLYPTKEKAITQYNPIKNMMPNWMPGAGAKGVDFQHGDPYTKIAEGEYRLPGKGYEARFRELEGVDPEDYPLIHKFKILADVAPHSREFSRISQQVKGANLDEFDQSIYDATMAQLAVKRNKKEFTEYKHYLFGAPDKYGAGNSKGFLAEINKNTAQSEYSAPLRILGSAYETLLHGQTPFEYLYPFNPESKFNQRRTAVESYERENLYGKTNSFWNAPFSSFILPQVRTWANSLGWEGIPQAEGKARDLEEIFDIIKYVKYSRLENIASAHKDQEAKQAFKERKEETLFGMNPYTGNMASIYRALPGRDRDYFQAFANAGSPAERERILEMVPANQRNLYMARWKLQFSQDVAAAKADDLLFGQTLDNAADRVNNASQEARSEGFPNTPELYAAFMNSKLPGENYGDWYRRTQLLDDVPLPGADWIGWHPSVDLEDIKMKIVLNQGEDMHDYNLWPGRMNRLAGKPYINDEATAPIMRPDMLSPGEMRARLNSIFASQQIYAEIQMKKEWGYGDRPSISVELES